MQHETAAMLHLFVSVFSIQYTSIINCVWFQANMSVENYKTQPKSYSTCWYNYFTIISLITSGLNSPTAYDCTHVITEILPSIRVCAIYVHTSSISWLYGTKRAFRIMVVEFRLNEKRNISGISLHQLIYEYIGMYLCLIMALFYLQDRIIQYMFVGMGIL